MPKQPATSAVSSPPRTAEVPRRRRRVSRRAVGIVVLVAGIVIAGASVIGAVHRVSANLDEQDVTVPGSTAVQLDTGRWMIFEATGVTTGGNGFIQSSFSAPPTFGPDEVAVAGSSGVSLVRPVTGDQTIERSGTTFTGVAEFSVAKPGSYDIDVAATGEQRPAFVGRPVTDQLAAAVPWIAGTIAGMAAVVLGIVLVVIPDRRRARVPLAPTATPGWYPDPSGARQLRWWDGRFWTQHITEYPTHDRLPSP